MTEKDVITLATQAGIDDGSALRVDIEVLTELSCLQRFAELVALKEREECAKLCEETYNHLNDDMYALSPQGIADAIRARGWKW